MSEMDVYKANIDEPESVKDQVIDMLERKLAEKEKEIEELNRMNKSELLEIKNEVKTELKAELYSEISRDIRREISGYKDDIVRELAVQLKNEILSLKRDSDNEKLLMDRINIVEAKLLELAKTIDSLTKEVLYLKANKIPNKQFNKRDKIKQQLKSSKTAKIDTEDDIIVCD